MQLNGHTVLVSGGATGIGFGIAEMFAAAGSAVIISGRRQEALDQARKKLPKLIVFPCDLSRMEERGRLAKWVAQAHPSRCSRPRS